MPFPAFWKGFLCIEQLMNEKKVSGNINETKPKQENARLLSKFARLINPLVTKIFFFC